MVDNAVLLACLGSTLAMTGLIWFVQVVHYPLFEQVGAGSFEAYHAAHTRRTTSVVVVPMVVELVTSLWLAASPPEGISAALARLGLAAALASWASTAAVQVPCHNRLASGFDSGTAARLVRSNWFRVVAWTIHATIVLAMAAHRMAR